MQITAYNFVKKNRSTLRPSNNEGVTFEAVLKGACSIMRPVFEIRRSTIQTFNYVFWENRYYFVDDIIAETASVATYHCSMDVLATHAETIGASSQYVVRSSSLSDGYIIDNMYPMTSKITTSVVNGSGFTKFNGGSYVLSVVGNIGDPSTGVTHFNISPTGMANLMTFMFGGVGWTGLNFNKDSSGYDGITESVIKTQLNPFQYITSCKWVPCNQISGSPREIKFGYWNSGTAVPVINDSNRIVKESGTFKLTSHPQIARGRYLNTSPYTQRDLYIYGFGKIPIDCAWLVDYTDLDVSVSIDLASGTGELYIMSEGVTLYKQESNMAVDVQISQVATDYIGAIGSVAGGIASAVTGNFVGLASGIGNAASSLMPQIQTSGSTGSKYHYSHTPCISSIFHHVVSSDPTELGAPLCSRVQISTLSGYVRCEGAVIQFTGTDAERAEVERLMNEGFYYESNKS